MESRHIALTVLFLIVAISILIIVSLTIAIKRHVYRRRLRLKSPYSPIGQDASKNVKSDIDDNLLGTQKIRCEPRLLQQFYRDNFEAFARSNDTTFIFRMKALDDFRQLEETLASADPRTRARAESCPSGRDRLRVYRGKHRALAAAPGATVEAYLRLYTAARHEPGHFGRQEHNRFAELQRELVDVAASYSRRSSSRSRPTSQLPLSPSELLVDLSGPPAAPPGPSDVMEMRHVGRGRRLSGDSSCGSSDDSQTALIEFQPPGAEARGVGTPGQSSAGGGAGAGAVLGPVGSPATPSAGGTSVKYTPIRRRDDKGGRANEGAQC